MVGSLTNFAEVETIEDHLHPTTNMSNTNKTGRFGKTQEIEGDRVSDDSEDVLHEDLSDHILSASSLSLFADCSHHIPFLSPIMEASRGPGFDSAAG